MPGLYRAIDIDLYKLPLPGLLPLREEPGRGSFFVRRGSRGPGGVPAPEARRPSFEKG